MGLFKTYLAESKREFTYRIKSVFPLEGEIMDRLERHLAKYDVQEVSPCRKTPIQKQPLEFNDIYNEAVYIVDVITALPMAQDVVLKELTDMFRIPQKFMVIRPAGDPLELEQELQVERAEEEEYEVRLSTSPDYLDSETPDHEIEFGDEYNEKFLSRIAAARMERRAELDELNKKYSDGVK